MILHSIGAVLRWSDALHPQKHFVEMVGIAEAQVDGEGFEGIVGLDQQTLGSFDSQARDFISNATIERFAKFSFQSTSSY